MYSKDKLIHPQLPTLNCKEFDQLRADIKVPDVREMDMEQRKKKLADHLQNNESNNLKGFEAFPQTDIILGCQQYIDNLVSKKGIDGLQIFEHDYHYYRKLNPKITYTTIDTLENDKPLLIAMPFPGHLAKHRQMDEILEICTKKNIDVHIDGAWLTSAFDIDFDFDQPCIKSFAMSFSKSYFMHWNKIGIRWSRELDNSDAVTIQNEVGGISRFNLFVATKYMEKFPIDYLCKKYKDQYFEICKALKLRPSNIIHACFSIDRKFLYGLKNFFD